MWTLQDAKNKFSAVVEAAMAGEPQVVTKRGKPAVTVIATDELERLKRSSKIKGDSRDFVEHLLAMPQAENEDDAVEFERIPLKLRNVEL